MSPRRLEAFSDGVMAIIVTIMVLGLQPPSAPTFRALVELVPGVLTYLLSFALVAIYWNNHHHLFRQAAGITALSMWANMHLLFWLSLVPLTTRWMAESHLATAPVLVYGVNLLFCALSYTLLQVSVMRADDSRRLERRLGSDRKGRVSVMLYALGVGLTSLSVALGLLCYAAVAVIWFVPDRRLAGE